MDAHARAQTGCGVLCVASVCPCLNFKTRENVCPTSDVVFHDISFALIRESANLFQVSDTLIVPGKNYF